MTVLEISDISPVPKKHKWFFKVKCKFCNENLRKMPYEEVYFQRLEEDNPEDYEKLKSKKSN